MKEKNEEGGKCPYCGFINENYKHPSNQLRPLTPLNGKYILGKSLGSGGFGITYIALDLHLQVVVAIKELYLKKISIREESKTISVNSRDRACFEENKKRFLQEARVLAMFNENDNEGVVIVKDHFEENNTAYIVMEYLAGRTLKEVVKRKKLSYEETKTILEPVFHALTKIHQFGVVHLDVSPDNIMVLENGKAKLLDFGGAKTIGERTENDIIAFKRGYAPPEQYMENGNIGQWTDVYAAAATMYYCMTGNKPVDSMERKAGADLVRLSKMGVRISPSIEKNLMKALELKPSNRYQTIDDFWASLNTKKRKGGILVGTIVSLSVIAIAAALLLYHNSQLGLHHQDTVNTEDEMLAQNTESNSNDHNAKETETDEIVSGEIDETDETDVETVNTTNDEVIVDVVPEETEKQIAIGDTIPMSLGTYIFENAANRNFIMGIDSGFGDDGTPLVLKEYEDSNKNRIFITDEIADDGFYNLRAAHTNSYIETSESQDLGEIVRQFSEMYDAGNEKWAFVYCGYDEEKEMDEVIIQNAAGSVLAPKDGNVSAGTEIILSELNMEDDTQKWYVRWSEKDPSEADVRVYHEGDYVEDIQGIYDISSALDGRTSISISREEAYHSEPTAVLWYTEWLTTQDTTFLFDFSPTGVDSRYRIFPLDQLDGEHKCLEVNPDSAELVMRDESDNENQLFRIVYVKSNTYLIQAYNEAVLGFDLDEDGEVAGVSVYARPYEAVEDSRLESWLLVKPHEVEE